MELVRELWTYMGARRKFWLLPIFLMLGTFGALIVLIVLFEPRGFAGLGARLRSLVRR